MPVNKNSLKRYIIEDRLLSDPNRDYSTDTILRLVNAELDYDDKVELRMIQKDIKTFDEEFGKKIIRGAGGRGTVKYEDQSSPLFSQKLTRDEEEVLREVLRTLGQFSGLDNFQWLDLLKKRLEIVSDKSAQPIISFSSNENLQMDSTILGRLFTAISRKKVIRFRYRKFEEKEPLSYTVYPYQLKQYNDRWYLLCNPVADDKFGYNPEFVATFPLDRMEAEFEFLDDEPYIEPSIDISARFDEIIGVTLYNDNPIEDIYFAVSPDYMPYVESKWLHSTQIRLDEESEKEFKERYPSLSGNTFFSIECRENNELYNLFMRLSKDVTLVEPVSIREELQRRLNSAAGRYGKL